MLERIRYRGDAEHFGEIQVAESFGLGTNRLAIVGRADGRQPLADATGRLLTVFNGEIYNFLELRRELERKGYSFRTSTDTEVLVHGYREWGLDLPHRLDGMFAFVLHDTETGTYMAARDPVGIKPLYHATVDGCHLFASEQKCLVPFCSEIETVPPGCLVVGPEVRRYHDLDESPLELSEEATIEHLRELFRTAVRKRVATDLPVAVTFSGGLDSTAVLHVAQQYHPDITAFTIGFEGSSDIEVATRYCQEHGIRHRVSILTRDDLTRILPRVVYEAEFFEGIDVMDTCLAYFSYQEIRRHGIKVALCGEGSDEVLAGYDLFRTHEDRHGLMRYRVKNLHRTDVQRVDRSSMMNSVEARVPFLDRAFLEFAYRVPMDLKIRDGVEKWVFRQAFRDELPDYIVRRSKVRMPDGSGMKNALYDYAARQAVSVPEETARRLNLTSVQERFFLQQYLEAGFPPPYERYRRPGYDFASHGYFDFVS